PCGPLLPRLHSGRGTPMLQGAYQTDYHVHTVRCGHAGGEMREYVLAALERGLDEIAFTDHIPLYFLPGEDPDPTIAMTRAELPGYAEEVRALKEEFAGRIDVLLGLEADYAEGQEAALDEILRSHDWDVVLGSVHWVAGDWIDAPGSGKRHETEGTARLWREYYRLLAKAAETGLFDVLTHFDLPKKFGHRMPAAVADAEATAVDAARRSGVAIEVSSAGLRKDVKEEYPGPPLLRKLVGAGVPIVLSSDAHAPAEVAWGRSEILAAARAAGAKEHLSFRKRERTRHPL
ncbi:MAG TPA: histidinol-phosphatase, partial [Thermoanaerobaculia bacterium]|nr:histidinol-phosphatase [Thermoanaerobaculia bacterium]